MKKIFGLIGIVAIAFMVFSSSLDEELLDAVMKGNLQRVKSLISQGADVNAKSEYGWTPLHWAAGVGHTEIVKLLIKHGADVNAKNFAGKTPCDYAKEKATKNL